MSRLIALIVLAIVVIACVGIYMDWFHLSTAETGNKKDITLSVDKAKIGADAEKAKEKLKNVEQKAKEKISTPHSDKPKSPQG
jgi:hypothetical protein